jgi:EmrB/QacA subfamily drug resistance transporter
MRVGASQPDALSAKPCAPETHVKYPCDAVARTTTEIPSEQRTAVSGGWIITAAILGSSLAFIDGTVVNVALPAMQHALQTTLANAQWVVEAYALTLAALILLGGAAGDYYGRRLVFVAGVITFAAASAWCGLAATIQQLIMARAAQGIGGAMLVPGSLAIISAAYPPETRGKAIGTWSGFTGITAAIGPVLGGWLVEHLSWRWVFYINLPIAIVVVAISVLFVPESCGERGKHGLDWPGAALVTAGLGWVTFALIQLPAFGARSPAIWGTAVAGLLAIVLFLWRESRIESPLLPLGLFRSSNFSGANLLTLSLYAALGVVLFFFPYNLIGVRGYTPTQAGAANLPFIFILFFLSRWAGGLVARYGAKLPLVIGPFVASAGFLLFARPGLEGSYWSTYFPALVVLGLGMSGVVAPLTTTVMDSVSEQQAGIASGVNNAVSRVASLLSIALFGLVAFHVFDSRLTDGLNSSGISPQVRTAVLEQRSRFTQIQLPDDADPKVRNFVKSTINNSFLSAFRWVMFLSALLAALSSVAAWFMIEGEARARPATSRT